MSRYYTRVCNFYYGKHSKDLVNKKKTIPLHQIKEISFDENMIKKILSVKKLLIECKKKNKKVIIFGNDVNFYSGGAGIFVLIIKNITKSTI